MSFLKISLTRNKKNSYYRKENRNSHKAIHFPHIYYIKKERASVFASKGSMTLEAAIVVPIYFFAILSLVFLLEIISVSTNVRNAAYSAAKELAMQVYDSSVITTKDIEQTVSKYLNPESGGGGKLSCANSKWDWYAGVLELKVEYEIDIPVLFFKLSPIVKEESVRVKGWNGYVTGGFDYEENNIVYITENGLVYHSTPNCTYLDMSIIGVQKEEVDIIRNSSGAKYYQCEKCGNSEGGTEVYVTTHGTRYHTTLDCKKIKRNVFAVSITDIQGIGGCSKCVK